MLLLGGITSIRMLPGPRQTSRAYEKCIPEIKRTSVSSTFLSGHSIFYFVHSVHQFILQEVVYKGLSLKFKNSEYRNIWPEF